MRKIENINVTESINKQRLIFEEEWSDKLDRVFIYFVFSLCTILPLITIIHADFNNQNDKIFSLLLFILVFPSGLYILYRKATEKNLFKITTPFDKEKNRQLLLDFAEKKDFEIYLKSDDYLIFNESIDDFHANCKKSMIFITEDNLVLFTVIQDRDKINLPTLSFHLFLKYNLKKLFNQNNHSEKKQL